MTLNCPGKYAGFQTCVFGTLGRLGPWKCLDVGRRLSSREVGLRASFCHINLGSSLLYTEFPHGSSFAKKYFPLIKKRRRRRKRRGMKERKKESAEGEDLMMCFQSCPNLESCSFWLERVSIVWQRKTPFFPSSYRFSHKTRHCGSGFSVINNLSTSQRWDTPLETHRPPIYL